MIQDLFRAFIQRLFHDRLLLGLLVIVILGVFFSGMSPHEDPNKTGSKHGDRRKQGQAAPGLGEENQAQSQQAAGQPANSAASSASSDPNNSPAASQNPPAIALTPKLAADFVHWWITKSMDYQMATAVANHKEANAWMLPEARKAFDDMYWGEAVQQGIVSGNTVGSFQPVSIIPVATNPDGSVVVTVSGTLVMQLSGQPPASQQLTMDFLVKKLGEGCRVAAFFNRQVSPVQQQ